MELMIAHEGIVLALDGAEEVRSIEKALQELRRDKHFEDEGQWHIVALGLHRSAFGAAQQTALDGLRDHVSRMYASTPPFSDATLKAQREESGDGVQ